MYQRHMKAEARAAAIDELVGSARQQMLAARWDKAIGTATQILEKSKTHPEALGIRAEALFALGIAENMNAARFGGARKMLADALEAGKTHPALERAQALSPIAANQPDKAIPKLDAMAKRTPKDGALQLYLGWANAAQGNTEAAIKAFDAAAALPAFKVHALFARGRAKQVTGNVDGAREDYLAVLAVQKDHLGAQIGLASCLPASQAQQAEADLTAILQIKDIEKKDPRSATQAWILAAQLAAKGNRLDVARDRFRKAIALSANDVDALTGLAHVELRDGKLDVATQTIGKALAAVPGHIRAQLVAAEISIVQKQFDDAKKRIEALVNRTPPPPRLDQAQVKLLHGRLLEAQDKEQDAIEAYLEAAKLAGEMDLGPTLWAVTQLIKMSEKAMAAGDTARHNELRKHADALLGALEGAAEKDPGLALTLGMAYLQANDPLKGETWLRKVLERKPKDVDAMNQLAKALAMQGKQEDAIQWLRQAVEIDATRSDIGLELARVYEDAKRNADAEKLYDKLLAAKEPPLELRARAGRFFARVGELAKAGAQGKAILAVQDDHPAGLYLKGEGLLAENKVDSARKLFVQASDKDGEAQYYDARGRAAERWAQESGNTQYLDDALRAYGKAVDRDQSLYASWIGIGRIHVARKEDAKAPAALEKAWLLKETAEVARLMGIAVKNLNKQPKVAAQWLEKAYSLERNAETAYNLGQLYTGEALNDPKAAIAAYQNATELAISDEKKGLPPATWLEDAFYELGDVHQSQNNLKGQKAAWQKYLDRKPVKHPARIKAVKQAMATTLKDI
jgi:Tfp pilus assembly protein PilF